MVVEQVEGGRFTSGLIKLVRTVTVEAIEVGAQEGNLLEEGLVLFG